MTVKTANEINVISKFYSDAIPNEALFSQQEAKSVLPFSDAWFERGRVYGFGPKFIKIGARVFYRKADLLNYINMHQSKSSTSECKEVNNG